MGWKGGGGGGRIQQQGSPRVKALRLIINILTIYAGNLFNPSWTFDLNRTEQLKNLCPKLDSVISVERF